jgi:NADPH-dependent ferric siderophore reductase
MMDDIINQMTNTLSPTLNTPAVPAEAAADAATSPPPPAAEAARPARRVQRVRHELRRRAVQVAEVAPLGPGFVAITFHGEDLADFVSPGFDDHIKFEFTGSDGQPVRRDYTPRRFDNAARTLTVEFALHGHGQACDWARRAQPGDAANILGPRGSMLLPTDWDWHLLVADSSALPALHRRLEELPAGAAVQVLAVVDAAADQRGFSSAAHLGAGLQVQWLATPQALLAALQAWQAPAGLGFAWCAGEAGLMRQSRECLTAQHGLPREQVHAAAYWKPGAADFHERLEG